MPSTVNGNVGGTAASGAQVQATHVRNKSVTFTVADSSGNYSFTTLLAGDHKISAFLNANVYYHPKQITVDGTSTYTDINLNPIALNASNAQTQATNF